MGIEKLITTKLTNERWLNLYRTSYTKDGVPCDWTFASRGRDPSGGPKKKEDAVVVIATTTEKPPRVVVISEYRVPIQGWEYHFPAGVMEPGQTVEQMAAKELLEEAGCILDEVRAVSPLLVSSAGMSDEMSRMVFCTCHPDEGGQRLEPHEIIEPMLLDASQVESLLAHTDILWAAKSWPILKFYVLPLLLGL